VEQTGVGYNFIALQTVYTCRIDNIALKCTKKSILPARNPYNEDNIGKLFIKSG